MSVGEQAFHVVAGNPAQIETHVVGRRSVAQRLHHRQVGIGEVHVFAHQAHRHRFGGLRRPEHHRLPGLQVRRRRVEVQRLADHVVETTGVEDQRYLVDVRRVDGVHHCLRLHVAEQADLPSHLVVDGTLGAGHDHVGLDAPAAQLGDRMLGGLGLELLAGGHVGHQGHVDVEGVHPTQVLAQLTDRLQEGQALDVAHGAADLGDDHVHVVAVPQPADAGLDLVGDVGDHLDGVAQVVAAPFLLDDRQVHRTRGDVGVTPQVLAAEPLVMSQIEIGLPAVVGDEHLAVLERVHGPRVDVDVGVQLLVDDAEPASLEETTERGSGDALAEAGHHASGHEHILGHGMPA